MQTLKKLCLLLFVFSVALGASSCGPSSREESRQEGENTIRKITLELRRIESLEDAQKHSSKLIQLFDQLVDIIIAAHDCHDTHDTAVCGETIRQNRILNEELQSEMQRVYSIEGVREIIEKSQKNALARLDAYEKALSKKREPSAVH